MNAKQRIQRLESAKPGRVVITWKDFIDWPNGKVFDADTEARPKKEWGKFIAKDKPTAKP
jgi:hypothetical protein